ncbi:hypothetical protein NHX12_020997 [Muraenolepis orangiensis]|uniref:G-protein coupled receptors family 2 profile 2 domain-containing protein n=1 Tax=Muraenolepis orangiensis TaxID=630683 RepID=A0A9Q0ESA2_9TELE|nr:hypothetical protein NHX12_020997 [Muraenolepis orangiensis]
MLTDSCPIPPLMPRMANQSVLLPAFLRGPNFTGFPEMKPPPPPAPESRFPSDTMTATAGPHITTTQGTPTNTTTTQHASLQSTTTPTGQPNTSLGPLGLGLTTLTNTTQTVNTTEVIQSAIPQIPGPNTTESSSLPGQARPDPPETRNATQTAPRNTAPTSGNTTDAVWAIAPDAMTAEGGDATFQNTSVLPVAMTPTVLPVAMTPTVPRSPAPSEATAVPPSVPRSPAPSEATAVPPTVPRSPAPSEATAVPPSVTGHNGTQSSPSDATANHSTVIPMTNETTTGSVAMGADRQTPLTVPMTTAALTYNWTGTNNNSSATTLTTTTTSNLPTTTSNLSTTTTISNLPITTSILSTTTSNLPITTSILSTTTSNLPITTSILSTTTSNLPITTSNLSTTTTISNFPITISNLSTTTSNLSTTTTTSNLSTTTTNSNLPITTSILSTTNSNLTTTTTTTPLPVPLPVVNTRPSSMTGSHQHNTNTSAHLPAATLPTNHSTVVTTATEPLPPETTVSSPDGGPNSTTNITHHSSATTTGVLIRAVDQLALKLEVGAETLVLSASSLALAVRTLDGSHFPETSLSLTDPTHLQVSTADRSRGRAEEEVLGSVFLPSSLLESLTPTEQGLASRVQFTFYTTPKLFQDGGLGNGTLVSPVLGSSVTNLSISHLRDNVLFSIRSPHSPQADSLPQCVFWDFSLNGGRGGWSPDGCFVLNGAILTFITYIGCGVSAVFLALTLLSYLCFQKLLRDIPSKILVQLCLTAFFLHYFLLTSFTWAGLEALHMYLSLVKVFSPYLRRYMLRFSLLGWGVPLVVVVVIISTDNDSYGLIAYGQDAAVGDLWVDLFLLFFSLVQQTGLLVLWKALFCWLRSDTAFYAGVVAYFLVVFSLCLAVFTVVLAQLARIKRQNPHHRNPQRGLGSDLRSGAGLVLLLGLTWGFALLAWGPLHLPFLYLFSIFNSLQGDT